MTKSLFAGLLLALLAGSGGAAVAVEGGRPAVPADATSGGVPEAQSSGDAGRVDIAVGVEARMNRQATDDGGVAYQHVVQDDGIVIYPADKGMNALWNGDAPVTAGATSMFHDRDWEKAPAFVAVDVKTTDGSRVKLDKLEMDVESSQAYRKPMLYVDRHIGCTGFRPSFSIKNDGWGKVKNMQMSIAFAGEGPGGPQSRAFTRKIGDFDGGVDVALRDVLQEAGVDVATLEKKRFACRSEENLPVCQAQVRNVGFGEIADFVYGSDLMATTARGTLAYQWEDDLGNVHDATEPFEAVISLAFIEGLAAAECGKGFGRSPDTLRYQDVRLPIGKENYVVDLPLRGDRNVSSYTARLKLQSEPAMSSYHQLTVAATFADGSVRKSRPVTFFFLKPRLSTFKTEVRPATACYIPDGVLNC